MILKNLSNNLQIFDDKNKQDENKDDKHNTNNDTNSDNDERTTTVNTNK